MMIGDVTTQALHAALKGLDSRRLAHENNLANIETPGYKARSIDFESQLRSAISAGNPMASGQDVSVSSAAGRGNGNNVNVDKEVVGLTETALTQQLVIRALNDKYGLIREATRSF